MSSYSSDALGLIVTLTLVAAALVDSSKNSLNAFPKFDTLSVTVAEIFSMLRSY